MQIVLRIWAVALHETLRTLHTAILREKCPELCRDLISKTSPHKEIDIGDIQEITQLDGTIPDIIADHAFTVVADSVDTTALENKNVNLSTNDEWWNGNEEKENFEENDSKENQHNDENMCDDVECHNNTETLPDEENISLANVQENPSPPTKDTFYTAVYAKDPFYLPWDVYQQASRLAVLCFELRCHACVSDFVLPNNFVSTTTDNSPTKNQASDAEDNIENNKVLVENKEKIETEHLNQSTVDENGTSETHYQPREDDEETDRELALFLQFYFHFFLQSLGRVQKTVVCSKGRRHARWNSLMKCARGESISHNLFSSHTAKVGGVADGTA